MDNKILLFVKFGKSKYINRLFNGKIYFSNAVKFREIEKVTGLKGQGDAFEAIMQLKNGHVNTDLHREQSFSQPNTTVSLKFADTDKIPVFCLSCIASEDCEIKEKNGKQILTVGSEFRDTIKGHFPEADTAGVFFQPQLFSTSLIQLGVVAHERVEYFDFTPNGVIKEMIEYVTKNPGVISERNRILLSMRMKTDYEKPSELKITEKNMSRILFCKDKYFVGEKEYRIILSNKRICAPQDYSIRWGKQKMKMYDIDEFFGGIEL